MVKRKASAVSSSNPAIESSATAATVNPKRRIVPLSDRHHHETLPDKNLVEGRVANDPDTCAHPQRNPSLASAPSTCVVQQPKQSASEINKKKKRVTDSKTKRATIILNGSDSESDSDSKNLSSALKMAYREFEKYFARMRALGRREELSVIPDDDESESPDSREIDYPDDPDFEGSYENVTHGMYERGDEYWEYVEQY